MSCLLDLVKGLLGSWIRTPFLYGVSTPLPRVDPCLIDKGGGVIGTEENGGVMMTMVIVMGE